MIREVTGREYGLALPAVGHVYNTVAFSELNRHKCDPSSGSSGGPGGGALAGDVRYLLLEEGGKVRGGVVLGRRGDVLHTPFSAPFGGLALGRGRRFEAVDAMWADVAEYAAAQGLGLRVTLPPPVYSPDLYAKSVSALTRLGMTATLDVSYHLDLGRGDFRSGISGSCKRMLNQALAKGVTAEKVAPTAADIERVYRIVEANHRAKDRPLWMSLADVAATARLVGADFFIVTHQGTDVAGAMLYPTSPGIAQLIYWGDMPGYSHLRPMNMLAYYIHGHYRRAGCAILDLGPATEEGTPNYGLCDFKESLGAIPTIKPTFRTP